MGDLALLVQDQIDITPNSLTDLHTCAAGRTEDITVYICNRGAATTFRLSLAMAGAADDLKQYIYYGSALPANDSLKETFTINQNDVIRAWVAVAATVSASVLVNDSKTLAT